MPWRAKSREDILQRKQERERGYQLNSIAKAKKREKDRLYQQRKREQARLECHEDPLAQLADVATQREYLAGENNVVVDMARIDSWEEETEGIEVSGMVQADWEVLENMVGEWEDGFNDDFGEGFDYGFGRDMNGMECLEITNSRGECYGGKS